MVIASLLMDSCTLIPYILAVFFILFLNVPVFKSTVTPYCMLPVGISDAILHLNRWNGNTIIVAGQCEDGAVITINTINMQQNSINQYEINQVLLAQCIKTFT